MRDGARLQRLDLRNLLIWRPLPETWWRATAFGIAAVVTLPIASLVYLALSSTDSVWPHLTQNVLPNALFNTLALILGTGAIALVIGAGSAWLVTMHRFPGRELADRLLVLPLAMPVYVVAYAYVDLFDYAGVVQSALRSTFGWASPRDYWFPDIRSLGGAILIFGFSLYPYVYLTARASFEQQSVCVLEVARTLGRTARESLFSIALPLARPALAAGTALVLMECLNDLGAVQYLGVETLSASIFATWMQRGNLAGAAQLALVLVAMVALIIIIERAVRSGSVVATTGRFRAIPFETLDGARGWAALALALLPAFFGFMLPFGAILWNAAMHFPPEDGAGFLIAAGNSVWLALIASLIAVAVAAALAYAARLNRGQMLEITKRFAGLGYALPGTVLALGLLTPLAGLDNAVDGWMREHLGVSTGLLLSGSLFAVTLALVIRFLAVALGSVEAGLERISPNLDAASRTLGTSTLSTLVRIHLPMLAPALGAAGLLVFVDTMKELPTTLLLRPFNFETLSTYIYGLTASERLEEAAIGAVAIVLAGIVPVLWLHRAIAGGRAGQRPRR